MSCDPKDRAPPAAATSLSYTAVADAAAFSNLPDIREQSALEPAPGLTISHVE